MIGNILLSVGSLFFSILLTIVYFLKAKQTNINNKIFKLMLILLNLTVLSEEIAITSIYYSNNLFYVDLVSRINLILTISWIINIACYVLTIGEAYKIQNFREYIKDKMDIKILMVIFLISLVVSLFVKFDNYSSKLGAYISGPALYLMYIIGAVSILVCVIGIIKGDKKFPEISKAPLIIGVCVSILAMILQRIFPMYLMLTCMFTFDTYLVYFMFENPDLYLIKELEISKQKAEDSNRTKTEFLSNMSHEIRTPMNAILGFSDGILTESSFDKDSVKKDISHIYSAGNNLLEIINNILDISKIETGEEVIENKEYSIGSIVLELKSIIESRINKDKIRFIIDVDPKTPKTLIGDKTKIFQVLLNILGNSVKYTEVGRIKLKITSEIVDNKALLHFQVSDTGYGIKKEDFDKMFEKFSRLDIATQKEIEGTGLGLVITKRLVTLLGGKVWFDSEYGAGTIFYIDLTQKISDIQEIGDITKDNKEETHKEYLDCSMYKVMLVDDNKLNLKVAQKVLSNYKFNITTFDNGKDCINDIKNGSIYDIIFLDHMMPKMDGIEVMKVLKKLDGFTIPPIIVLTANAIAGMKEMYLNEGFDGYLSKPINPAELDKLINMYFNKGDEINE